MLHSFLKIEPLSMIAYDDFQVPIRNLAVRDLHRIVLTLGRTVANGVRQGLSHGYFNLRHRIIREADPA